MSDSPVSLPTDATHSSGLGGGFVIDAECIEMLRELGGDDDPGLLAELIELYLEDAGTRVRILKDAGAGGDLEAASRAAHALKSASANIGALRFSEMCREIEASANSGGSDELADLVKRSSVMYAEVESVLAVLLESSRA